MLSVCVCLAISRHVQSSQENLEMKDYSSNNMIVLDRVRCISYADFGPCPVHFTPHLNSPSILARPGQGTGPAPSAFRVSA